MSEMIERVRATLEEMASGDSGCGSDRCCCSGLDAWECRIHRNIDDVIVAVIKAMREPTETMLNAEGEEFNGRGSIAGYLDDFDAKSVWQAMIDAALNEAKASSESA